ncbi:pyruvate formate lyase activating enzyme [Ruminiclostridium sufflavum DSM 19573]|uniref:Pyruvate formate lyase activating enzyme n=1 Tax=Ruminiclostridium sufflavum DSM 19573 TaxID=1121337 RepID=A0A318XI68_9FIRM|nr:glycyl-radical enzyme activating protein [Ruminiclostridium sufflavum]PYG86885.1 pyruvate formate lyase activating enzyme [Ruminiclostridium sufflavum DSM 19573]
MTDTQIPFIFDIKRGSLEDGPGIRSTVFFKGCPLRCVWCHNPEAYSADKQMSYDKKQCIGCGSCFKCCPQKAVKIKTTAVIASDKCTACGICAEKCPAKAIRKIGRKYIVKELVDLLLKDKEYYYISDGGVTFSGGEPLMHIDYLHQAVRELKLYSIKCAVQTCGYFDYSAFQEKILPYLDIVYYDIKIWDTKDHKQFTSVNNEKIITNFKRLIKEKNIEVIARTPQIPGVTDTKENIEEINAFLKSYQMPPSVILHYNSGGQQKRENLI